MRATARFRMAYHNNEASAGETCGSLVLSVPPPAAGRHSSLSILIAHGTQEEVYFVVRGKLALSVEGTDELELAEGDLARVPATVRRQLVNRSGDPCTIVAIGAAGSHESRDAEAFTDFFEVNTGAGFYADRVVARFAERRRECHGEASGVGGGDEFFGIGSRAVLESRQEGVCAFVCAAAETNFAFA